MPDNYRTVEAASEADAWTFVFAASAAGWEVSPPVHNGNPQYRPSPWYVMVFKGTSGKPRDVLYQATLPTESSQVRGIITRRSVKAVWDQRQREQAEREQKHWDVQS